MPPDPVVVAVAVIGGVVIVVVAGTGLGRLTRFQIENM